MAEFRNGRITDERSAPVSVEEAFATVATGEGLADWFPLKAEVEPRVGGRCLLSWGEGCEGEAPIHLYEPGERFGWTESHPGPEGADPTIRRVEFEVSPRGGSEGGALIRLTHSGFAEGLSSDDPEVAAYLQGWSSFMHCLEFYLSRHHPKRRRLVWRYDGFASSRDEAWSALIGGEGCAGGLVSLATGLEPGAPVTFAPVVRAANGPGGPKLHAAVGRVVSAKPGGHLNVELPALGRSLLFIEFEEKRVGVWLSTWGLRESVAESIQAALDEEMAGLAA